MRIETGRLLITDFSVDMCRDVHLNSLDEDNRRFVPDEVFETLEEAEETVSFLIEAYSSADGPFVHPILRRGDGANIGYVQAVRVEEGFEIGYHIAKAYTGFGYASEAVSAFLPAILKQLGISQMLGVVLEDNKASHRVLEKCGFRLFFQGIAPYQGEERSIRKYLYQK